VVFYGCCGDGLVEPPNSLVNTTPPHPSLSALRYEIVWVFSGSRFLSFPFLFSFWKSVPPKMGWVCVCVGVFGQGGILSGRGNRFPFFNYLFEFETLDFFFFFYKPF